MNAGSSPNGQLFSAKHANMNFVMLKQKDRDSDAAQINHLKNLALDLNRSSQCWIHGYVVCRETEQEAKKYLNHYVIEKGDDVAVSNMLDILELSRKHSTSLFSMNLSFISRPGMEVIHLLAPQIKLFQKCKTFQSMGVDGILLSWLDYIDEAHYWIENVLPRLEQAGLRDPSRLLFYEHFLFS